MIDELDTLSDAALNEVFAVEVAGWERRRWNNRKGHECSGWDAPDGQKLVMGPPQFSTDANAVLAWLEKTFVAFQWNPDDRCLTWLRKGAKHWDGGAFGSIPLENGAFARAACIALIRAKRAQKP